MLNRILLPTAFLFICALTTFSVDVFADGHSGLNKIEQGRDLAFKRSKGNCLACHYIEGGELMGNYGPPLLAMKVRYPDREVLRAQIWDAAKKNPDTRMPPFGRNHILTEEEIDLVTDFIHTL
jgi:sulfur-oxidizing protein SoxX